MYKTIIAKQAAGPTALYLLVLLILLFTGSLEPDVFVPLTGGYLAILFLLFLKYTSSFHRGSDEAPSGLPQTIHHNKPLGKQDDNA